MEPEQGDQKEQLGQEQGDEAASSASRGRLGHVEACAAGWPTLRPPAHPVATPGPLPGRGIPAVGPFLVVCALLCHFHAC